MYKQKIETWIVKIETWIVRKTETWIVSGCKVASYKLCQSTVLVPKLRLFASATLCLDSPVHFGFVVVGFVLVTQGLAQYVLQCVLQVRVAVCLGTNYLI